VFGIEVMFWLGLILPLSYIAGITGVSIPTYWAVLSALLPIALWRKGTTASLHWIGLGFLLYVASSIAWTDPLDGVYRLWQMCILGLAFWLGTTSSTLRDLFKGLAVGLTVSSLFSVYQWFNGDPLLHMYAKAPGLMLNPMIHAEMLALVIVGLLAYRMWAYIPLLLPGMVTANSRGAWLALGIGSILCFERRLLVISNLCLLGILAAVLLGAGTDVQRMQYWQAAFQGLTLFGYGAGATLHAFFLTPQGAQLIEHIHNDYLQLAFEFGVFAIIPIGIYALALGRISLVEWPVFAIFALMSTFSFPFFHPALALVGTCVAGHLLSDWPSHGYSFNDCRSRLLSWLAEKRLGANQTWSRPIPVQSRATNSVPNLG
jgi:hypothetical protein